MKMATLMCKILEAVDNAHKNQNFSLKKTFDLKELEISKRYLYIILENLLKEKYIAGLIPIELEDGITFSVHDPKVTAKGLLFLDENEIEER